MGVHKSELDPEIYQLILDQIPNMVFINDFKKIVYVNQECIKVMGYTEEEYLDPDFDFMTLIAPESHKLIESAFKQHMRGEDVDGYEYSIITKNNEKLDVIITTKLIEWDNSLAILGIITDITYLKKIEEELKSSEEKYQTLLESSNDGVYGVKGTELVYVNRRGAQILGYDNPQELLGKDIEQFVAPEHKELVRQRTLARQKGENPPNKYDTKLLHRNGRIIDVEFNISSINLEGNNINLTFVREITKRLKFENAIKALHQYASKLSSSATLEEVIDNTLDAMENTLDFEYSSFLEIIDNKLIIHSNYNSLNGLDLKLDGRGLSVKAANTKKSILVNNTREVEEYVKGTINALSELDVPVLVDEKPVAVLNVESEEPNYFTEQDKELLELLATHVGNAIQRLRHDEELQVLQEKRFSDLIDSIQKAAAMVRHDLRVPLSSIVTAAYLLREKPDDKKLYESLTNNIKYVEAILEDWKQQTHTSTILRSSVNLSEIFETVVKLSPNPDNIKVIQRVDKDLEFWLDRNSIMRALTNLITNSYEAMPEGGELILSAEKENGILKIQVSDTGIGIEDDLLEQVFLPFFTTKFEGRGLGLSYVKQSVNAHDGSIKLESAPGQGTTFTIVIPQKDD